MTFPQTFPELGSPRLLLRACTGADAPGLLETFSHPEVMRYWSTPPWVGPGDAERFLGRAEALWQARTAVQWVVDERGGDRAVGTVALYALHEQCARAEVGYTLRRSCWGRGYMQEALTAVLDWAFDVLGLRRVEADVDPRNERSVRALERLHFSREGLLRERWDVGGEICDTLLLGLLRRDWVAGRRAGG